MNPSPIKKVDPLLNPSNLLIAVVRELGRKQFTPELLLTYLNNSPAYYFQSGATRKFTSRDFLTQVAPLLQTLITEGLVEKIDSENYRVSQGGLTALRSVAEY